MDLRFRRLCECKLKTCDDDKGFREGDQDVARGLDPYMDALRRGIVDVVLQNGSIDHGERSGDEANEDASDGVEVDLVLAKKRIDHDYRLLVILCLEWERTWCTHCRGRE